MGLADAILSEIEKRTQQEIQAFADIALILYPVAPPPDRARLSRKVSVEPRSPMQLVMRIAQDEIRIALPILECFTGFSQEDLYELATTLDEKHLQVLARRSDIHFDVSNALTKRGNTSVRRLLAGNREIVLSPAALKALVRHAVQDVVLREDLATRTDLTPAVCELLMPHVRGATKQRLQQLLDGVIEKEEVSRFETLRALQQKYAIQLENMSMRELWSFAQGQKISLDDLIALLLHSDRFDEAIELLGIATRTAKGIVRNAIFNGNVSKAIRIAIDAELSLDSFSLIAKARCDKLKLPQSHSAKWIQSFVDALQAGAQGSVKVQGVQDFAAKRNRVLK
ncbi:MAG: DUF2336 domain-containing protein [Rhodobacteraceae bacterium]|nr:DUF2336 domain-containing protein [Paracoccaceae bacterium]